MSDGSSTKKQKVESPSDPAQSARRLDACSRCRKRKVKCDQNFPSCSKCLKAGEVCFSIERATGRVVPRSYVYYLEQKVISLENSLRTNGIELDSTLEVPSADAVVSTTTSSLPPSSADHVKQNRLPESLKIAGSQSYMGASSGITFAKLMMAAVKMKDLTPQLRTDSSTTTTNSEVKSAVLPPKLTAQEFIRIYFAQSNSQLPILHRDEFLTEVFEPVYGSWDETVPLTNNPLFKTTSKFDIPVETTWFHQYKQQISQILASTNGNSLDTYSMSSAIEVPVKFHRPLFFLNIIFAVASSVNHLQYLNSISGQFRKAALEFIDSTRNSRDPLEQLQTTLLLALYSLMRPCVPGVWYVLGQCLRLSVDLGLHKEASDRHEEYGAYTKDKRRRLFWCTYSLDRQVCFYMGRPVGIPETSIKANFPSELDDSFIVHTSTSVPDYSAVPSDQPSYKNISILFFRIRQIQSEVSRVLYEDEELPRRFDNLTDWTLYIDNKLENWWKDTSNPHIISNIGFHHEFFNLNYNHTKLLINGLSPKCFKLSRDAFMKVAESSQNLIECYSSLYVKKAINYTWAAVQNLFMAGTSFLFTLYHSDDVRERYAQNDLIRICQECIVVLNSLNVSCDAARDCSQTFQTLTAAVLRLRYGSSSDRSSINDDDTGPATGNIGQRDERAADGRDESRRDNQEPQDQDQSKEHTPSVSTNDFSSRLFGFKRNITEHELEASDELSQFQESNLQEFFTEVSNLSPMSSAKDTMEDNSMSNFTLAIDGDSTDWRVPARDGKRVFELIQQVPMESIWDQFFTVPNNPTLFKIKNEEAP